MTAGATGEQVSRAPLERVERERPALGAGDLGRGDVDARARARGCRRPAGPDAGARAPPTPRARPGRRRPRRRCASRCARRTSRSRPGTLSQSASEAIGPFSAASDAVGSTATTSRSMPPSWAWKPRGASATGIAELCASRPFVLPKAMRPRAPCDAEPPPRAGRSGRGSRPAAPAALTTGARDGDDVGLLAQVRPGDGQRLLGLLLDVAAPLVVHAGEVAQRVPAVLDHARDDQLLARGARELDREVERREAAGVAAEPDDDAHADHPRGTC